MDDFAERLKRDAEAIDARITPELEQRIGASLHAVERPRPRTERRDGGLSLWWASSLTGVAAAAVLIVAFNLDREAPPRQPVVESPPALPDLGLAVAPAMLTGPLEQELKDLRRDLEKAEQAVREDVPLNF